MDLYAFTEMLRRQRRLLGIGALVIVGAIVVLGFDFTNGFEFRAGPEYETKVQLAVVPADFESILGTVPDPARMAGPASLYATLLASPEASVQIFEATGPDLKGLEVIWSGNDGFIAVNAIARSREASIRGALASFDWLNDRLDDPLTIERFGSAEPREVRFDESGTYIGGVRLEASAAFEETSQALWITVASADDQFSSSLVDAAILPPIYYFSGLRPGESLNLALETPFGEQIDTVDIEIPEPPDQTTPYDLVLRVNHGAVVVPATSAPPEESGGSLAALDSVLVGERISALWVPVGSDGASERAVALALLTQNPVAVQTGTRRGPILVMAALVVGFFALLVLAATVDTWRQDVRSGEEAAAERPHRDGKGRFAQRPTSRDEAAAEPSANAHETDIPPGPASGDEAVERASDRSIWPWQKAR